MTRRLAILLESPAERPHDARYSPSWWAMGQLLAHAGIDERACHIDYLFPHGEFVFAGLKQPKWGTPEMDACLQSLQERLSAYQPHFVLLLDRYGGLLRAFHGDKKSPDEWRGSVLLATHICPGIKVMATYAPSRLQVEMGLTGVLRFDLKRVVKELATDKLDVPQDHITVDAPLHLLLLWLKAIQHERLRVAIDIEGYVDFVSCIGFATSHNEAFVIPFMRADGTSWWTEEEEVQLWEAVAAVLADPAVPKVLQNSLYDCFVLAWSYGIVVEGIVDDTMLKHFEMFAELEKSLAFQTSIYTRHPYYKFQRKSDDERVQLEYCGCDCCRTLECCDAQEAMLKPQQREHYQFNLALLAPILYMELRGIRYDKETAQVRLEETQQRIYEYQDQINQEAARSEGRQELRAFYEAFNGSSVLGTAEQGGRADTQSVAEQAYETLHCGGRPGQLGQRNNGGDSAAPPVNEAVSTQFQVDSLLPLLAAAFVDRTKARVRESYTVTTWQPLRHNGKKWVRNGKRIANLDATCIRDDQTWFEKEGVTYCEDKAWQACHTVKERTVPAPITSLEDVRRFAKDSLRSESDRASRLLRSAGSRKGASLTSAQRGELATLLGLHIKVNATGEGGDAQWYLYDHCQLPRQFQKEGNKLTTRLATDDEAIIKAYLKSGADDATRDQRALHFLEMRKAITQTKFLRADPDLDGRIRSSMNLVGTPTCRMAMYGSPTGTSDLNLQTIGKGLRDLFVADEGCYLGQKDLSNADAYAVAAFCAAQGDQTMLDDLKARIKPANVLARIYEAGPSVNQLTRDQLRDECKKVDGEGWLYFACKRVLHGCYTAGHELLTPNGWVAIERLGLGEKVACYDLHSRKIHFERPSSMTAFDYSGNLYTFEGHSFSLTVTADHKMPYTTNDNPKWITAAEMHVRKACNLPTAGIGFQATGPYSRNFGQLIAAIHSDGCYHKQRGYLTFNFKKARKIARIQLLLTLNELPFTVHSYKDGTTKVNVYDKEKLAPFKVWGKEATAQMLNWGEYAIVGYLDEYCFWDGHQTSKHQTLFSVKGDHIQWIDTFAHLALRNGCYKGTRKSGFLSTVHVLSLNNRSYADRGSMTSSVVEVDKVSVYCPTVSTGFVLVRRNGKICASGNSNYGMGKITMANQILTDSFKLLGRPIWLSPAACEAIQEKAFFVRYPGVRRWHKWMQQELATQGVLRASTGFQRRVFGRKDDHNTLKECLAHFPQYFTTYAIKSTLVSLQGKPRQWTDPENRRTDGSLIVESLLLVHDSNLSQWRKEDTEFAKRKLAEWFQNEIVVAGQTLVIPASGTYGVNWKEQTESLG